ncbi:MAG TPA: SDR family oxidoreductase [Thermoleophilaceae bacterium]|nr:SDR family oxidoreductase [Thermoleophilaceae bacterium]
MELNDSRILVAGATGTLGGHLTTLLGDAGANLAVAARSGGADTIPLELTDPDSPAAAVAAAAEQLGGLDGLVVATGAVAFGTAGELDDAVTRELFAVNTLGPIALVRAALERIEGPGGVACLSAIVADFPTAGMASYSASKAGLSAYLTAVRREVRKRGITVLDVRPPHLDTPFSEAALAGEPPKLPEPGDPAELARAVVDALRQDKRILAYDMKQKELAAS